MILFRIAWVIMIGIPLALILFTLAMLFAITILGLPMAAVLLVLAVKALSAPF